MQRAYAVLSDPEKRERYDKFGDAGTKVATLREQAEAQLAQTVVQAAQQCDTKTQDVVDIVRTSVVKSKMQFQHAAAAATAESESMRDTAARLTKNDGGESVLSRALVGAAEQQERVAKHALFEVEKGDEMLKVLAEHKYRTDAPKPPPWGGGAWSSLGAMKVVYGSGL